MVRRDPCSRPVALPTQSVAAFILAPNRPKHSLCPTSALGPTFTYAQARSAVAIELFCQTLCARNEIVPFRHRYGLIPPENCFLFEASRQYQDGSLGRTIQSIVQYGFRRERNVMTIEVPSDVSIGRVDGQQPDRNERVSSVGSSSSSATSGDCRSPMLPAESKRSTSAKPARSRRK
jgi:hypothetical protein